MSSDVAEENRALVPDSFPDSDDVQPTLRDSTERAIRAIETKLKRACFGVAYARWRAGRENG